MKLKWLAWLLLTSGFIFGITDRSYNLLIDDGIYSAVDLIQLFTALFYLVCTLFLIPNNYE